MADLFLESGENVVQVNYKNKSSQTLKTSSDSLIGNTKIAVIINKGSASASEILAGALAYGGNATIVGQTSFGKGTVQELVNYSDKSSLKITTAEWLIPTDLGYRSINNAGIRPDFAVTISNEDIAAGNDAQLNKAIFEVRN
jgi:carboxyl-terminal processing protease